MRQQDRAVGQPMRRVLIFVLSLSVVTIGFAIFVDRRADLREAGIEARFPPIGQMVTVASKDVHVIVKGTGPDLVLIHGAGGNARDFDFRLMDRLTDHYRVFAVDRPGLGWSEPLSYGASPLEQARHLAAATRALGAENPIVLGHSFGGSVAMGWALEEPAAAIVILSGATMPWPGDLRRYYRVFGSKIGGSVGGPLVSAFVSDAQIQSSVEGVFAPAPVPPGYITQAAIPLATRAQTFRESARQVNTLRPHIVEQSKRYGEVAIPVEILHGTADTTVYAEIHAFPLSEAVQDGNVTLIEGVGHAPHHVEPDTVVDAIDRAALRAGLR